MPFHPQKLPAFVWLAAGLALLILGWSIPVNLKSVTPALLQAAGKGTPSLAELGKRWVHAEKLGPSALILKEARALRDPGVQALEQAIAQLAGQRPESLPWGGWDPFLDPLMRSPENQGRKESTPVVEFFVAGHARDSLRRFLGPSRSLGVQAILRLRELTQTGRFVPAAQPGGQPLETVILLTALLYQGEHLSGPLREELRTLAERALAQRHLDALETFFLDLLSLAKRLDWMQLCELLRRTESAASAGEYAHLARVAPDALATLYAAALADDSADRVARYLMQYGRTGLEDLKQALRIGQGALHHLLLRQVPINYAVSPTLHPIAVFGLLHPRIALGTRWAAFLGGCFLLLRGLNRLLDQRIPGIASPATRLQSGVVALLLAVLLATATEPFILKGAPPSEFKVRLVLPALAAPNSAKAAEPPTTFTTMDTTTLLSIAFFAALQVGMYFVCLLKIREIAKQPLPPLVRLRLMENEENLFDGGLYIGIGGTATALVLQVLGLIEANLLAAYSSNLFGITCVALVKIRHVRPYKRTLILEANTQEAATSPATALS